MKKISASWPFIIAACAFSSGCSVIDETVYTVHEESDDCVRLEIQQSESHAQSINVIQCNPMYVEHEQQNAEIHERREVIAQEIEDSIHR